MVFHVHSEDFSWVSPPHDEILDPPLSLYLSMGRFQILPALPALPVARGTDRFCEAKCGAYERYNVLVPLMNNLQKISLIFYLIIYDDNNLPLDM